MTAPRWRRGLSTLMGFPAMPVRKLIRYDSSHLASDQRTSQGLTLVLPGIDGYGPFPHSLTMGLGDALPHGIEMFEWTTRRVMTGLTHLCDLSRNREQASRLADRVEQHQQRHPGTPVHLVGHSGGAAVSVFALEELAQRAAPPVTAALLLGPALWRGYDLTTALEQAERTVSFYSLLDIPHLVVGTVAFGSIDRRHGVCGGFLGFRERDEPAYARLEQRPYRPTMVRSAHLGGHMGWTNRLFAAEHLAPLLTEETGRGGDEGLAPA